MKFEEPREASTPEEMRAEIFRLKYEDATVKAVIDFADYNGLSSEDRYTVLAYHALVQMVKYKNAALEYSALLPMKYSMKVPE